MSSRFLSLFCFALMLSVASLACQGPQPNGQKAAVSPDVLKQIEGADAAQRLLLYEVLRPNPRAFGGDLESLLEHDELVVRAGAAKLLAAWAADGDRQLVAPALADEDALVRGLAQTAYMERADGRAPVLVDGTVYEVPGRILREMADLREPQGLADIESVIADRRHELRASIDGDLGETVLACEILARIGDIAARRKLVTLAGHADGAALAGVARALTRPEMDLGPVLLDGMFSRADEQARRGIVRALVIEPDPRTVQLLNTAAASEDEAVRRNAIRAMGNLGAAAPVDTLRKIVIVGADEEGAALGTKLDALAALGAAGGKEATDVLRQYLLAGPERVEMELQALLAIAPHAHREDIDWIMPYLRHENALLRAAGAKVLGRIGHPSTQAALLAAVDDPVPLVRASIVKAVGQIATVYGSKHLATMVDADNATVRAMALWGLGHATYRPALAEVADAATQDTPASVPLDLGDLYVDPKLAAIQALGRINGPEGVEWATTVLEYPNWVERYVAAATLEDAGVADDEIIAALKARLDDASPLVRARALWTLKTLGETFPPGYFQTH